MPLSAGQKVSIGLVATGLALGVAYVAVAQAKSSSGYLEIHATLDGAEVSASGSIVETGQAFTETPATIELPAGLYTVRVEYGGQSKTFTALAEKTLTKTVYAHFTTSAEPEIFSLTADNMFPVVKQGQSVDVLISVIHVSGDNKETFLNSEAVGGGSSVFSQPAGLPSFDSVLAITAPQIGVHALTVSASNPDHSETLTLTLTVEEGEAVGKGNITVETYYQTLLNPVSASFTVMPGEVSGTSPATVSSLDVGYYTVHSTYIGEPQAKDVYVEANKTIKVQIIFTGQYA